VGGGDYAFRIIIYWKDKDILLGLIGFNKTLACPKPVA
jgi:hypothetical protein